MPTSNAFRICETWALIYFKNKIHLKFLILNAITQ
jgi:hypothetical protein